MKLHVNWVTFLRQNKALYKIKQDEGTFFLMKMGWAEDHDFQLAKEFLVSEPYSFKPRAVWARLPAVRTVKCAKIWQYVDRK